MRDTLALERWKRTLLTAPDDHFFQIVRTWLGDVKTPFNKHDLIRRLVTFFRKPATTERVLELIDTRDARVLTAVTLIDQPTVGNLYALFEGSTGYLKLHYHLQNLEERMLVYRDETEGEVRISLHPLFAPEIRSRIVHPSLLFRLTPTEPVYALTSHPSDVRLVATAARLHRDGAALRADGTLRKRADAQMRDRFHEDRGDSGYDGIASTLRAFRSLGLFSQTGGSASLSSERWRAFCRLDGDTRRAYLTAACAAPEDRDGTTARPVDEAEARAVHSVLGALLSESAIDAESFSRLYRSRRTEAETPGEADRLLESLTALGLVARIGPDEYVKVVPSAAVTASSPSIIQPDFEVSVPIGVTAAAAWFLPFVAELVSFDTVTRFEISRDACMRGFAAGLDTPTIETLLNELCSHRSPLNVIRTISGWEQEYRSIRIIHGTVVLVDETRRHLFDHDERIKGLVDESIAPGAYVMRSDRADALRKVLAQAGVESVPPTVDVDAADSLTAAEEPGFRSFEGAVRLLTGETVTQRKPELEPFTFDGPTYRAQIESHLAGIELTTEERSQLDDRIDRRLILFPEQMGELHSLSEIAEAKGFDYLGKVRIIEQALAAKGDDLLEIVIAGATGTAARSIIRPDRLEKEETGLVLFGRTIAGDEPVTFRVRSIGLIRKRRGSSLTPATLRADTAGR